MMFQNLNIDLEMGTKFLINESAYFLGGIFAANESIIKNDKLFWIAPVRHNSGYRYGNVYVMPYSFER